MTGPRDGPQRIFNEELNRVIVMSYLQKIYVESSVWYQLVNYAESDFKKRAVQFIQAIQNENFTMCISNFVLEELGYNKELYRKRLEYLLEHFKPTVLLCCAEAEDLALAYLENAFPGKRRQDVIVDAFHAALATACNISYVATYNYRNLLNVKVLEHVNAINVLAGYNHHLMALPPFMFLDLHDYEGDRGSIDQTVWHIKGQYGKKLQALLAKERPARLDHYAKSSRTLAGDLGLPLVTFGNHEEI